MKKKLKLNRWEKRMVQEGISVIAVELYRTYIWRGIDNDEPVTDDEEELGIVKDNGGNVLVVYSLN